MQADPRLLLICAVLALTTGTANRSPAQETRQNRPIQRGVEYLLAQQADDGLWHSETYGNLKDGAGVSALALYAIGHAPESCWQDHRPALQKCVDRLAVNIDKHGYVANADGPDYSNYGSAMLLVATRKLDLKLKPAQRIQLIRYLLEAQLDEDEGYDRESPDFGGWDLSGWMKGERKTSGTNISVTASVLEALAGEYREYVDTLQDASPNWTAAQKDCLQRIPATINKALAWMQKVSHSEGGFFFHPEKKHAGNKAEWSDRESEHPRVRNGNRRRRPLPCIDHLRVVLHGQSTPA